MNKSSLADIQRAIEEGLRQIDGVRKGRGARLGLRHRDKRKYRRRPKHKPVGDQEQ